MRDEVARDLSDSSYDFTRVVWPAIAPSVGGGRVIPVESIDDAEMAHLLDVLGGIDCWQVLGSDRGIRGIASRVQWGSAYDTFTIRESRPSGARTELEKRLRVNDSTDGTLYPYLTVQAYVDKPRRVGALILANIAKTDSLMEFVLSRYDRVTATSHGLGVWRQVNPTDGVTFVCVSASKMAAAGCRVKTVRPNENLGLWGATA